MGVVASLSPMGMKAGFKSMQRLPIVLLLLSAPLVWGQDIVVVCPVTGMIDEGVAVVVKRAIKEAGELNAKAIIFRVDTPGGRVDSAFEISAAIEEAPCRTIAFIEGMGAISAGALISFSCDDLIMTPSTNIGAATPVIMSTEGMLPTGEKEVSVMRAKMRALGESNHHNSDIAEAMVDKDIELRARMDEAGKYIVYKVSPTGADPEEGAATPAAKRKSALEKVIETIVEEIPIRLPRSAPVKAPDTSAETPDPMYEPGTVVYEDGSKLVLAKGKLLTLTPEEAIEYGVIPAKVTSLHEVVAHYELGDVSYHVVEANWAEAFFRWITGPTMAGLLLMLGMGGLYFEVKTPGFGVPGIIAAVCLTLFFGSHYILGLTEVIDLVLVIAGVLLILLEIFVLPGFGVAGVAGLFCVVVGLYLSLVDFTIPQYSWEFDQLREVGYSLGISVVSFMALVAVTWKILPRSPLYNQFVMQGAQEVSEGYVIQSEEDTAAAVGLKGRATSMLRPAGRGRFGDKTYMVVTRGNFIENGAAIEIVQADGNRYVVDRIDEEEV